MEELPKIVVDERGYLRVKLPSGEMLPEISLKIENVVSDGFRNRCDVTVTFMAEHDLVNRCIINNNNNNNND